MKRVFLFYLVCFLSWSLSAQRVDWSLALRHFFDNTEFDGSSYQHPQTMAGVWLDPAIGVKLDTFSYLHAGVNLLKEYGTSRWVDDVDIESYYAYQREPVQFFVGSFPREGATRSFSRVFFQDSINFYRPTMTGMWWHYAQQGAEAGLFLDWTGKKSQTEHEAFFVGATGTLKRGVAYATLQALLRHHAASEVVKGVQESGLCHVALGVNLTEHTCLDSLTFQAGYLLGLQRDRTRTSDWSVGNGFLTEVHAGWKGFGLQSSWYFGKGMMHEYPRLGNKIYWGDPFYSGKVYGRTDLMYDFFTLKPLIMCIRATHHYSENRHFFEQSLVGRITINGYGKK